MSISLIACCDLNLGIGFNDSLLTHLPNDLKYFKQNTTNKICVFGRKTYESLPTKPLPNRINVILTKDKDYKSELHAFVYHSVEDILKQHHNGEENEIMICGGSNIYHQFIHFADRIYLTIIDHKFQHVDSYFPKLDDIWRCVSNVENKADENNPYDHNFLIYKKK